MLIMAVSLSAAFLLAISICCLDLLLISTSHQYKGKKHGYKGGGGYFYT
jgi:hypothetical protein